MADDGPLSEWTVRAYLVTMPVTEVTRHNNKVYWTVKRRDGRTQQIAEPWEEAVCRGTSKAERRRLTTLRALIRMGALDEGCPHPNARGAWAESD